MTLYTRRRARGVRIVVVVHFLVVCCENTGAVYSIRLSLSARSVGAAVGSLCIYRIFYMATGALSVHEGRRHSGVGPFDADRLANGLGHTSLLDNLALAIDAAVAPIARHARCQARPLVDAADHVLALAAS
jgi:hypothetical protein